MIILVLLAVSIIISVFSLLLNILLCVRVKKQSRKRRELKEQVLDLEKLVNVNQRDNIFSLDNHRKHIEDLMKRVDNIELASPNCTDFSPIKQQPIQQQVSKTPQEQCKQNASSNQSRPKQEKKKDKKNTIIRNDKPQQTIIKTIFLGINSDDIFFDTEEQKSESSRFIASLTSETEGTYKPIDVERVRAVNVAASIKQSGIVTLKDAQSFNVIEPGVIRKEDNVWRIEKPVIVEFIK